MYEIDKLSYLRIGVQGENVATTIEVDMTTWADEYPGMRPNVLFLPYNEEVPFVMTSEYAEPILTWTVTSEATQTAGVGYTEIRAVNPDTQLVKKTKIIPTSVERSITPGETNSAPPGFETWLNRMLTYKDAAEAAVSTTESARAAAVAAKTAAQTAQALAEEAQEAAEDSETGTLAAQTAAEAAQTAAESAQSAAETAQAGAVTAKNEAEAARSAAQTYQSRAQTAQTRAESAQSGAVTALNSANSARNAAVAAQAAAEDAQEAAEAASGGAISAKTDAETAYAGATVAKTAAEAAQTAAESAQSSAESALSDALTCQQRAQAAQTRAENAQAGAQTALTAANTAKADAIAAKEDAEAAQVAAEAAVTTLTSTDMSTAYVATDGDDANDGSKEHPFATISKAFQSKLVKTVIVEAGEYTQGVSLSDRDVRIICVTGTAVFNNTIWLQRCRFELDHIASSGAAQHGFRIDASAGILRDCLSERHTEYGFRLLGSTVEMQHCVARDNIVAGIWCADSSAYTDLTLLNCIARSNREYGVLCANSAGKLYIIGGEYSNNKYGSDTTIGKGVALEGSNCTCEIHNAFIHDNNWGIRATNTLSASRGKMFVSNCLIRDNKEYCYEIVEKYDVKSVHNIFSQSDIGAQGYGLCWANSTFEPYADTQITDPTE